MECPRWEHVSDECGRCPASTLVDAMGACEHVSVDGGVRRWEHVSDDCGRWSEA